IIELRNTEVVEGATVAIPYDAVEEIEGEEEMLGALIKVSSDKELMESIVISIPKSDWKGHTLATIDIEYEWKPPCCSTCNIFYHEDSMCPKHPKDVEPVKGNNDDGFTKVKSKKNKPKQPRQCIRLRGSPARLKEHVVALAKLFLLVRANDMPQSDFNDALFLEDVAVGASSIDIAMREFKEYVEEIEVMDVQSSGLQFTWTQKPKGKDGALKKIDRIMMANRTRLDADSFNSCLREEEARVVVEFNEALIMQERFLKQKAKVVDAFVAHYSQFLGQAGITESFNTSQLFTTRLDDSDALYMVRNVTQQEVKDALFSMGNDKAPGPDGYTTAFFKEAWGIVADDVTNAVREFFTNGKLLKELNHTIIALIPKVSAPTKVTDYRPISCCNVLFKCISKIIANRIKESLKALVSQNQSAFVPGRSISDNILLTQELMHNYHLDRGVPRCAFKVDIQKAYDTVDWLFLREVLVGFGFHERMIAWIMECVTTSSFSICINGSLHGYFKGKRGLRQGDPLSPYLFTLVMEILTLMLQRRVRMDDSFTYHRYCSELELINLCFADDLFLFAHGDVQSASTIKEALEEFKEASGLVPSLPKSTAYFCNVLNHTKLAILNVLPFDEGRLPVKYLGVPLVSSRLLIRDCKELVEKVQSRIMDWKNKSLSIAGRLQLARSVIGSMHIFWASVFIIPMRVLLDLEQLMRGFIWCQGSMRRGQSKVAWDVVCLPKNEGGLGLRWLD
ncbi:hypothetical protein Tco_1343901, partial [Tanacetum coccineum]